MNDLDQGLREMFRRHKTDVAGPVFPPPQLVKRVRQRQFRTVSAALLGVLVVIAAGVALSSLVERADQKIPADPPKPPLGVLGALAYVLDGDIYVADPDGSNAARIADGRPPSDCHGMTEYWSEGPIWSPDGRYLAYRRANCDGPQHAYWDVVIISDPEGNLVTSFPGDGWLISWSPDSTRVAVWVEWGNTIGVYGLDGERQTLLTLPPGLMSPGDRDPVWSPDGASLLVPYGVMIPLDGTTPRQLPPEDPRTRPYAAYSPDGSRVAYVENKSLVVAAADGSDAREVVGRWAVAPVWSPTGDRIAFIYSEKSVWRSNELRVLDVATGEVTSLAGMGGSVYIWNIQFAPEGDRILFSRKEEWQRGASSLWSINADGSDPRRLVTGTVLGDWQSLTPSDDTSRP